MDKNREAKITAFNAKHGNSVTPKDEMVSPENLPSLEKDRKAAVSKELDTKAKTQSPDIEDVAVTKNATNKELIQQKVLDTKEQRRQEKAASDAAEQAEQDAIRRRNDALELAQNQLVKSQEVVSNVTAPAIDWLSKAPTPGGMLTIVLVLIFFVLAVIPVDAEGNTRLKLIWLTLTGKTHLRYSEGTQGASSNFSPSAPPPTKSIQGASGNFGTLVTTPSTSTHGASGNFGGNPSDGSIGASGNFGGGGASGNFGGNPSDGSIGASGNFGSNGASGDFGGVDIMNLLGL